MILELEKKNKDLSNDLNSLKSENQNSNTTIVKIKYWWCFAQSGPNIII